MSIKLTAMVEQKIEVKSVSVHAKIRDSGSYEFKSPTGTVLKDMEDEYVPSFFPGDHYGDYLILDIDLETGQILNWKAPTSDDIKQVFSIEED